MFNETNKIRSKPKIAECKNGGHIILDELKVSDSVTTKSKLPHEDDEKADRKTLAVNEHPVFQITKDGLYNFMLSVYTPQKQEPKEFQATVHIEIRAPNGFLSAVDWPLLPVSFC